MLCRFWEGAVRGGYPGHGETYLNKKDILWWSHGGELHGESHKRFHLLRDILAQTPGMGLTPYERAAWDEVCGVAQGSHWGHVKDYYLYYYSFMRPAFRDFYFDDETEFEVNLIDTWETTIEPKGLHKGRFRISLPAKPFMAIQIKRVNRG